MECLVYSRGLRFVHSFSQEGRKGRRQEKKIGQVGAGARGKGVRGRYTAGAHKISSGEGPSKLEGEKGHSGGTVELGQEVQRQLTERVAKH